MKKERDGWKGAEKKRGKAKKLDFRINGVTTTVVDLGAELLLGTLISTLHNNMYTHCLVFKDTHIEIQSESLLVPHFCN